MDVSVTTAADAGTSVGIDGHIWGFGPVQKSHLRKAMTKLETGLGHPSAA